MRDGYAPRTQRTPFPVPGDVGELPLFLEGELRRLWSAVQALAEGHLPKTHAAPAKPRDGDVRYADGTDWNPGSGEGAYIYYNAAWNKLG